MMQTVGMNTARFRGDCAEGYLDRKLEFAYNLQSGGKIEINVPPDNRTNVDAFQRIHDLQAMYPEFEAMLKRYIPGALVTLTSPTQGTRPSFRVDA